MKKFMALTTLIIMAMNLSLYADLGYDGPSDNIFWKKSESEGNYFFATSPTSLAKLALDSDIIGVGQVSQRTNDSFIVTIDHALVGCTNGAIIQVHGEWHGMKIFEYYWRGGQGIAMKQGLFAPLALFFPTNQSQIVFTARTNELDAVFWNEHCDQIGNPIDPNYDRKYLSLNYLNRSWWYVDRDDGILTAQFTNILQAVRVESDWANYFHLCRDGAFSMSDRVKEDSFWDMRDVARYATLVQIPLILADPLVDPKLKDLLNTSGWNNPNLEAP